MDHRLKIELYVLSTARVILGHTGTGLHCHLWKSECLVWNGYGYNIFFLPLFFVVVFILTIKAMC